MDSKLGEVLPSTVRTNLLGRTVTVCSGAMRRATGNEKEAAGEVVALFAVRTMDGSGFKTLVAQGENLREFWVSEIGLRPDSDDSAQRAPTENNARYTPTCSRSTTGDMIR